MITLSTLAVLGYLAVVFHIVKWLDSQVSYDNAFLVCSVFALAALFLPVTLSIDFGGIA